MRPSLLLNVSSDLLRAHVERGMSVGPMASESDRGWTLLVFLALTALIALFAVTVAVTLH